ncbi:MAG: hypothetical protein R6V85_14645 [Polyangia bacterium]
MSARRIAIALAVALVFAVGALVGVSIPEAEADRGHVPSGWECPTGDTCFFFNGPSFFVLERESPSGEWNLAEIRRPPPTRYTKPSGSVPLLRALK